MLKREWGGVCDLPLVRLVQGCAQRPQQLLEQVRPHASLFHRRLSFGFPCRVFPPAACATHPNPVPRRVSVPVQDVRALDASYEAERGWGFR